MTQRGKWAEGKVRDYLKKQLVVWYRFPDAMAGYKQVTPSDFMVYNARKLTLIEVKEVKHTHLLPYKNVPPDQIARMRLWKMQGAKAFVVVAFRGNPGQQIWVAHDIDLFIDRPTDPKPGQVRKRGSWDLSSLFPLSSLPTLMEKIL